MRRKDFLRISAALVGGLSLPAVLRPAGLERRLEEAAGAGEERLWALVRDQFLLDPEWTYLNFGGLGACPFPVLNSLWEWTREEERAPSAGHDEKRWNEVKTKLAGLLGKTCRAQDLALIGSATEGINMIVNGLPLRKGDEVITTTHEHVALNSALLNRRQKDGIVIRLFEPDIKSGPGNVDRVAALMNKRTRLVFISHVTCTNGQRFPEAALAKLCRERGVWYALDGAQGPVCVPFDIVESGADFYASSTHKWVMAPKRTGFLYVRPERLEVLRPQTVGGGSSASYDILKDSFVLHPSAQRFEYGTQNDALFYALGQAVDFIRGIGTDRIWGHNHGLAEQFYAGLLEIPGVEVISPEEKEYRSAMISFRMAGRDFKQVNDHLAKDMIRVRTVGEQGINCLRVSFHVCNHGGEVDKILDSLKKLAKSAA